MQYKEGMEQEYLEWKKNNEPSKDDPIGYGMAVHTWAEDWSSTGSFWPPANIIPADTSKIIMIKMVFFMMPPK